MKVPGRQLHPLLLFVITLLAYSNSFQAGFVLDNRGLILNDDRVHSATAENLGLIVDHTYWWPHGESGLYRPFTTFTYLFNYAILGNGTNPIGYHVFNLLVHLCNVLLIYALALRLTRKEWPAFFVAALWGVHPILTEDVTNIAGRADLLAAFGVLAGLWTYLKGRENPAWFAATAVAMAIGAFSKESAVVVIGVVLLYDVIERRKPSWPGLVCIAAPIALMLYQRAHVLAGTKAMEIPFTDNPIPWVGFRTGRLMALTVFFKECVLILWPATLSADYSWAQIPVFQGTVAEWLKVLAVVAILPGIIFLYRWSRTAFFFFLIGLAWLAPAANILFPAGTIMAERLLYLTAAGIAACVVFAAYAIHERYAPVVLCVLVAALGARTLMRNIDWTDDLSIATASVRSSPNSFKTHDLLANVLFTADPTHRNIDLVISESRKGRAILDSLPDERKPSDPYRFAANCYMIRGDYPKAEAALLTVVAIEKAAGRPVPSEVYAMLSTASMAAGHTALATSDPMSAATYAHMAETQANTGHFDEAAVALIEGAFITSDKTLRQDLIDLYQHALDPKSCALISGPGGPAINPNCPIVHKHVCDASDYVVKTLRGAGQEEIAAARRIMFDTQFHCKAETRH